MDCPACGHANRSGARFCASCAAPLTGPNVCPRCGGASPAGHRFCDACGAALGTRDGVTDAADPLRQTQLSTAQDQRPVIPTDLADKIRAGARGLAGERKQVTVLFADVVGSMALSEHRDPEQWRNVMKRVFTILCEGVHRFEGTVDRFTGDGIIALFGAPIAHEDHARRACHAALELKRELAAHGESLRRDRGIDLALRIGLNSGEVIFGAIGEDLAVEYTAVGHTVGLAQRMESLAKPGTVYVSEGAASLVEGFLELRDLGELEVKGVSRRVHVFELVGVGCARGRLDVERARGLTPFVGRDEELELLERALARSVAVEGQVVGIVGEAGVGKSRLCHELAEHCRAQGMPVYEMAAQAHARAVPLLPVLQLLRSYFEIAERDSDELARERIEGTLLSLDRTFADELPLIFDFLAVSDPTRAAPQIDPEARQRRLLSLMRRLAHVASARQPGVVVLEDMHWLDPASEVFVANHIEAIRNTRGLAVLTFRPEYRAPWMGGSYYRQLPLAPLTASALGELLRGLLGQDPSLDGLAELILGRTEGNPFFAEELVRSLAETGSLEGERGSYRLVATAQHIGVPATVQSVLAARIDRLSPAEKYMLQAAAVIGREVPAAVLERVVELSRQTREDALHSLRSGEFLYERRPYPDALYEFKHPLTQEVAYGSQLAEGRAALHTAVALALAEQHPDRLEERAALIAHHFEQGDERLEAARWSARAAQWAGFSDPFEARSHWRRVQQLADSLEPSREQVELALSCRVAQLNFAWRLGLAEGQSLEQFERATAALESEACALAEQTRNPAVRAIVMAQYGVARGLHGDLQQMLEGGLSAVRLAQQLGDAGLELSLRGGPATALFLLGRYRELEALARDSVLLAGGDPSVGAGLTMACPYAWHLMWQAAGRIYSGRLPQAIAGLERAAAVASEREDVEVQGWVQEWLAYATHFCGGDAAAVVSYARDALECAQRTGSTLSLASAHCVTGLACLDAQQWSDSTAHLHACIAIGRERGIGRVLAPIALAHLARAQLGAGEPAAARATAEAAVKQAVAFGTKSFELEARLAFVAARRACGARFAAPAIEAELDRGHALVLETGALTLEPRVHLELAELARLRDEGARQEQELASARHLFDQIGAPSLAERLMVGVG
jgi:class 3 adenylate cyclase